MQLSTRRRCGRRCDRHPSRLQKLVEEPPLNSQPQGVWEYPQPFLRNPAARWAPASPGALEDPAFQAGVPKGRYKPWRGWRSSVRLSEGEPQGEGLHGKVEVPMAR